MLHAWSGLVNTIFASWYLIRKVIVECRIWPLCCYIITLKVKDAMALTFSYSQNIWMGSDGGSGLSATDSVSRAKKWTKARAAIAGGNMLGERHCNKQENLKISEKSARISCPNQEISLKNVSTAKPKRKPKWVRYTRTPKPVTNNWQPTMNNQQPTTNSQQPLKNNQQPTTNN